MSFFSSPSFLHVAEVQGRTGEDYGEGEEAVEACGRRVCHRVSPHRPVCQPRRSVLRVLVF